MKTEILYLVYVTAFTSLFWVPYVLNRIVKRGLIETVSYPENPKPLSPWAQRLLKAHANAIENLVVFATLVLAAAVLSVSNAVVANACIAYFWARVVHALAYTFAIPWIRTLAFLAGFGAQVAIALQLLAH
jgi:uncharacterized MAPEG superfamily protein